MLGFFCFILLHHSTITHKCYDFPTLRPLASIATTQLTASHHTNRKHTHRIWFIPQNIESIIHICWVNKYFAGQKNSSTYVKHSEAFATKLPKSTISFAVTKQESKGRATLQIFVMASLLFAHLFSYVI